MKVTIVVLAFALGFVGTHADKFKEAYDKINAHLDEIDTDEITANFELIEGLVATYGKDDPYLQASSKAIFALEDILDRDACDLGYNGDIIRESLKPVGIKALVAPETRLDRIIQHFVSEHAKVCNEQYPNLLANKKTQVSPDTLRYVDSLISKSIPQSLAGTCKLALPENEAAILNNLALYDHLIEVAKDDKRYSALTTRKDNRVDRAGLMYLFTDYIDEPCQQVHNEIGESLFALTNYDLVVSSAVGSDADCAPYANDAMTLRVCEKIATNGFYRQDLLDDLATAVGEKIG